MVQSQVKNSSFLKWMARGVVCASLVFGAGLANAGTLTLDFSGDNVYSAYGTPTGASALVEMDFLDAEEGVEIQFSIANTTGTKPFGHGATRSRFTGLALDLLDGMTLLSTAPMHVSGRYRAADTLIQPVFIGGISNGGGGAGKFSFGIADNDDFVHGDPRGGLRQGQSVTVSLLFATDNTADGLMAAYAAALFDRDSGVDAAVRFQRVRGDAFLSRQPGTYGYTGPGSDKLLFAPAVVPLPAAGFLMLGALGGLGLAARRRRKS